MMDREKWVFPGSDSSAADETPRSGWVDAAGAMKSPITRRGTKRKIKPRTDDWQRTTISRQDVWRQGAYFGISTGAALVMMVWILIEAFLAK